jgi:hypothetical protein
VHGANEDVPASPPFDISVEELEIVLPSARHVCAVALVSWNAIYYCVRPPIVIILERAGTYESRQMCASIVSPGGMQ